MLGILNDDMSICLKHENCIECKTKLEPDFKKRIINSYFIKDDMEFGVVYAAITGDSEYSITKIKSKDNVFVIRLKQKELVSIKKIYAKS